MRPDRLLSHLARSGAATALVLSSLGPARALVPPEKPAASLRPAGRVPTRWADAETTRRFTAGAAWRRFLERAGGTWTVRLDALTGRPALVAGSGLPLLPGPGNELADTLRGTPPSLERVEQLVREQVLVPHADLLGVDPAELELDRTSSAGLLAGRVYTLDFVHAPRGIPVEGAGVGVRINSGNLILLGTVLLADVGEDPPVRLGRDEALAAARRAVGGPADAGPVDVLERGTLLRFPVVREGSVTHRLVWRLRFTVPGRVPTWEARVDVETGELLTLADVNDYQCEPRADDTARVIGGVLANEPNDPEIVRPLPHVVVAEEGVPVAADLSGRYVHGGGAVSSGLDGSYVSTTCVTCTNPAQALATNELSGLLDFGVGGLNDEGNGTSTRAERSTYYHASYIRLIASKWHGPGEVPWFDATMPARVNIDSGCNAFWNGVAINMFHAQGGCGNTGEVAGVVHHEWGHGLDQNTGRARDGARGEGVGDVVATLASHSPLVGPGFRGPGNAVRCLDWRTCNGAPGPLGTPLTVDNVADYCPRGGGSPLGREVHCEGQIYGQASWDLALNLVARHGPWGGWHVHEGIFFPAMLPASTYLPEDVGGAFWAYVTVDDDNGDLTDGTPHADEIFAAFDLHGIAPAGCAGDPACPSASSPRCTPPADPAPVATPVLSPDDGSVSVELAWAPDPAVDHWAVYRAELGEDTGYIQIADRITEPAFVDDGVFNGLQYWYVVQPVDASGCTAVDLTPATAVVSLPELRVGEVEISDVGTGDGDGVFELGEVLTVRLLLHNRGQTTATVVSTEIASEDAGLAVVLDGAASYPDIGAGETVGPLAENQVQLLGDRFDCGQEAPFSVLIRSADGCWAATFSIPIGTGAADVSLDGLAVADLDAFGNGNGRADPGEEIDLALLLVNAGTVEVTGADVLVRSLDPAVTVLSGASTVPPLPPGVPVPLDSPLRLALAPDADCPGAVRLELSIVGAEGCWSESFELPVGWTRVLFEDDFETDRGWTYGSQFEPSSLGTWTRGVPNGVFARGRPFQPDEDASPQGLACALTGNEILSGNEEHGDLDATTSLLSPAMDLTGEPAAELSYRAWFATDSPGDSLLVEARVDAGPWQLLERIDTDTAAWTRHAHDLVAALGPGLGILEIRFTAAAADPSGILEAAIDDVAVSRVECEAPAPVPELALADLEVDDGAGPDGHGNGDGVLDPLETPTFVPVLTNVRNADALNVRLTLRPLRLPSGTEMLSDTAVAPDVAPGANERSEAPHFALRLPDVSCGEELEFELSADYEDAAGLPYSSRLGTFSWRVGSRVPSPCDPFADPTCSEPVERIGPFHGFEGNSDRGWAHGILHEPGVVVPTNTDDWERKAPVPLAGDPPVPHEGLRVFGTDLRSGSTDAAYEASTHTFLESPSWDASSHERVHLRYARWLSIQGSDFDEATVAVNGAEVWRNDAVGLLTDDTCVDPFGAAATLHDDGQDVPGEPAGWKLITHDVSAVADGEASVVARFELRSDVNCSYGGWNLDSVELLGVPSAFACTPHDPCSTPLVVEAGPARALTCDEPARELVGTVVEGDGRFGYEYRWSPVSGLSDPLSAVTRVREPGTYTLTVRDLATGCVASDEVTVVADDLTPELEVSTGGPITCDRNPTTVRVDVLAGNGSQGYVYSWTPGGFLGDPSAPETTCSVPGLYTVRVTDVATGCRSAAIVSVLGDREPPIADAGPDRVSTCFGAVELSGSASGGNDSEGYVFAWSPPADLDDPTSPTPRTSVPGTYELTVTCVASGCSDTSTVVVTEPGDRVAPEPVGGGLRLRRDGMDVVLDVSRHPAADGVTYAVYRDVQPADLDDDLLDLTSPLLHRRDEPGPTVVESGEALPGGDEDVFYRVHAVNPCGLESP